MKRLLSAISLAFLILAVMLCMASCGGDIPDLPDEPNAPTSPVKLDTPTVILTDNVASWTIDIKALNFEIDLNGTTSTIENNVGFKILKDGDTFKLRAVGDGKSYTTSDWSNTVTYTVAP